MLGDVFHLADGRIAVAAVHGDDGPTDVDVILLQIVDVRQIHHLPVRGGTRQAAEDHNRSMRRNSRFLRFHTYFYVFARNNNRRRFKGVTWISRTGPA